MLLCVLYVSTYVALLATVVLRFLFCGMVKGPKRTSPHALRFRFALFFVGQCSTVHDVPFNCFSRPEVTVYQGVLRTELCLSKSA